MKIYTIIHLIEDLPAHSVWLNAYRTREAAQQAIVEYLVELHNDDTMNLDDIDPDEFEIHELDLED